MEFKVVFTTRVGDEQWSPNSTVVAADTEAEAMACVEHQLRTAGYVEYHVARADAVETLGWLEGEDYGRDQLSEALELHEQVTTEQDIKRYMNRV